MKNIIIFLAICVAVALGHNAPLASPIPPTCAILDQNWKLWDVSTKYFNTTDNFGVVSANLCLDMEKSCAHTTNEPCSICQFIQGGDAATTVDSYCLGYSKDEVYSPLNATQFPGVAGFRAALAGDNDWCPQGLPRNTYINVLCNQRSNAIQFLEENPACTYSFTLSLTQNCSISPASFTPTFTISGVTPNAFELTIDDGYPYEYWNYNVKVNGKYGYQGSRRDVLIDNLDPATTYTVVVERESSEGAVLKVVSPSVALKVTTLESNLGNIHTTIISGTGTGVVIGLVIAGAFLLVIFGFLKLRQTEFWADKFGGGGQRSGKGFSLLDAEKATTFE